MRTDISTSGRAAVTNERMRAAATHPAGISPATPSRLVVFLMATLTMTWLAFLPMITGFIERTPVAGWFLLLLGAGSPSLTAFVLSAVHHGWAGVRRLGRAGTRWRVNIGWYLAILTIPGLAYGGSSAMSVATGVSPVFNPLVPALISGLLAGLLEEFGWSWVRISGPASPVRVPPRRRCRRGHHRRGTCPSFYCQAPHKARPPSRYSW